MDHPNHHLSHEIATLELYVTSELTEKLPSIEELVRDLDQVGPKCARVHTSVSGVLRQVLASQVSRYSPRLAAVLSRIWDTVSRTTLVLLKSLAKEHSRRVTLELELDQRGQDFSALEKSTSTQLRDTQREMEELRIRLRDGQAENYKLSKRHDRVKQEREHLQHMIERLIRAKAQQDPKSGVQSDSDSDVEEVSEINAKTEIQEFESVSADFDQLMAGVMESNRNQMADLNDLDRFINSSLVSVLFRHTSNSKESFLAQMLSTSSVETQTEVVLPESQEDLISSINPLDTRHAIPLGFTISSSNIPKHEKILPRAQLSRFVLQLLIEKLEHDCGCRPKKPRLSFPMLIQRSFKTKFGLNSLAERHLVELIKSCSFYLEHEPGLRSKLKDEDPSGASLPTADARLVLFCRLIQMNLGLQEHWTRELVSNGVVMLMDFFGDLVELEPSMKGLDQIFLPKEDNDQFQENQVWINREVCVTVTESHLEYLDSTTLAELIKHIRTSTPPSSKTPNLLSLEWILSTILYAWVQHERMFVQQLKTGFHHTISQRPRGNFNLNFGAGASPPQSENRLTRVEFQSAFVEVCSAQDVSVITEDEVELVWNQIQMQQPSTNIMVSSFVRKSGLPKPSPKKPNPALTLLGAHENHVVTEAAFVSLVGAFIRSRRPRCGIRTRGIPIFDAQSERFIGGQGREYTPGVEMHFKPTLSQDRIRSIMQHRQ